MSEHDHAAGQAPDDEAAPEDELGRHRRRMDEVLLADRFARELGVEVEGWGGGWARARLQVVASHTNLAGTAHGGVAFALGDIVFAVACNSWGRLAVALTVEIQYLAAARVGDLLTAEARERHRSRRTASYAIEVRATGAQREAPGELVASLQAMAHRTDRWHLGEQAWSSRWRAEH